MESYPEELDRTARRTSLPMASNRWICPNQEMTRVEGTRLRVTLRLARGA